MNLSKKSTDLWIAEQYFERGRTFLAIVLIIAFVAASVLPAPVAEAGVVIKPQNIVATGGTITTVTLGNTVYKVHTFTSTTTTQSFTVTSGFGKVWYLVVAGGGGGGKQGGGGGAGGLLTNNAYDYPVATRSYTVTVGAGGAGSVNLFNPNGNGVNGATSTFATISSTGGGGGGSGGTSGGSNGGSGGGAGLSGSTVTAGSGIAGQGSDGGGTFATAYPGGGGGGAGGVGQTGNSTGGNGGAGLSSSISGTATLYAGGGGGGSNGQPAGTGQAGGGNGGAAGVNGTSATDGTGGGGGGGGNTTGNGGDGGDGIVIIRYPIGTAKAGVTAGDPYWNNVVLLVANDSKADTTTSFADQSKSAHALTTNGNAQYSTASPPTGLASSALFDGTTDYLSSADSNDYDYGTGDFTIEWYQRWTSIASFQTIYDHGYNVANAILIQSNPSGSGLYVVYSGGAILSETSSAPNTGQWYHYALTRSGTSLKFFRDGVLAGSATNSTNFVSSTQMSIGAAINSGPGSYGINGRVAGFRITKGVARYTANFTPPTLPLPTGPLASAATAKPAEAKNTQIVATGGTITTVTQGGITRKVHTFTATTTSSFTVTSGSGKVWYLVVAGGGGGGGNRGGGGGGGGFLTNGTYSYPVTTGSYTVTVGSGGAGNGGGSCNGSPGADSVFSTITATGGGYGGGNSAACGFNAGGSGGSGGGGGVQSGVGGSKVAGQGNNGGDSTSDSAQAGGGGGGAGAVGSNGVTTGPVGGNGGNGLASVISGSSTTYAGGGGGGSFAGTPGSGGSGGGGNGSGTSVGQNGTVSTGGGGGGSFGGSAAGNGGSGIVIISYITNKQTTSKNAPINGLVGWWPFDSAFVTDKIYDRSGRANNGYFVGSATSSAIVAGKIGRALNFNGTNNKITFPTITTGTTFTYSAWLKPNSQSTDYGVLFASDSGTAGIYYRGSATANNGKITFYYSLADHLNNTALINGGWNHIVVVNNAGNVTFYLNGVADGTATGGISFGAVEMGSDQFNELLKGTLDDVRIYNRALSAAEVLQLYNSR